MLDIRPSRLLGHKLPLALIVGFSIWLFGIFVKFPQGLLSTSHFPRLDDYLKLCANPFARDVNLILAYRISVPVLAWVLHLPPVICTLLPILFLISSYALIFYVLFERTGDKQFALLVVAGLSLTFFALWTNRWLGYSDSFSHLCSAVALLSSNPFLLALCCIIGTINDERWLMSVPFLLYWHGSNHAKADTINWTNATRSGIGLAAGVLVVLLVRYALTVGWLGPGIVEPGYYKIVRSTSLSHHLPYASTWPLFALNVLMGLGWYWVPVVRLVLRQVSSGTLVWGYFLGLSVFIAALSTLLDEDVSRSIGFLYLAVVIASSYDHDAEPALARIRWRNLLLGAVLTPTIYYTGLSGAVFIPFPIDLANHLIHEYRGVDLLQSLKLWFRLH
jgi:hypothetical protein